MSSSLQSDYVKIERRILNYSLLASNKLRQMVLSQYEYGQYLNILLLLCNSRSADGSASVGLLSAKRNILNIFYFWIMQPQITTIFC